jgi:hypothetical protein
MSPKLQRLPTSFLPLPLSSPRLSGRVRVHLLRIREPTYPQPGGTHLLTFRLPPAVTAMLTKRRVYSSRLWARPLGVLGFSWAST